MTLRIGIRPAGRFAHESRDSKLRDVRAPEAGSSQGDRTPQELPGPLTEATLVNRSRATIEGRLFTGTGAQKWP
jgi:hypothetical protein